MQEVLMRCPEAGQAPGFGCSASDSWLFGVYGQNIK